MHLWKLRQHWLRVMAIASFIQERPDHEGAKKMEALSIYSEIANDVIRPSAEECSRNSRARSTKMRWAVRAEE